MSPVGGVPAGQGAFSLAALCCQAGQVCGQTQESCLESPVDAGNETAVDNDSDPEKSKVPVVDPPIVEVTPVEQDPVDASPKADQLLLWAADTTWGRSDMFHPYTLGMVTYFVLLCGMFAVGVQTARMQESRADKAPWMLLCGLYQVFGQTTWMMHGFWFTFSLMKGDQLRWCIYLITPLIAATGFYEMVIMQKEVALMMVALTPFLVLPAIWCVPGGPRRGFATGQSFMFLLFQIPLYGLIRYLPLLMTRLAGEEFFIIRNILFPCAATVYETAYMPLIFCFWRWSLRGTCPEAALTISAVMVRYTSEGLYYAGIMFSVHKNSDDMVPLAIATCIITRLVSKVLSRIGFWDLVRGVTLGREWNDMTAERDFIGRVSSTQTWMGFFVVYMLAVAYLALQIIAMVTGQVGNFYYGGVMTRPIFWPCICMSAFASMFAEMVVAVVVWFQRKGRSPLSILQTFNRLHEPAMQSMLGNAKGYDKHGFIETSAEQANIYEVWPCCQVNWQQSGNFLSIVGMLIFTTQPAMNGIQSGQ